MHSSLSRIIANNNIEYILNLFYNKFESILIYIKTTYISNFNRNTKYILHTKKSIKIFINHIRKFELDHIFLNRKSK